MGKQSERMYSTSKDYSAFFQLFKVDNKVGEMDE
jgi:hypothetical protein